MYVHFKEWIEGRRGRGRQRTRWLDGILDSTTWVWAALGDSEGQGSWSAAVHAESDTTQWLNNNVLISQAWDISLRLSTINYISPPSLSLNVSFLLFPSSLPLSLSLLSSFPFSSSLSSFLPIFFPFFLSFFLPPPSLLLSPLLLPFFLLYL